MNAPASSGSGTWAPQGALPRLFDPSDIQLMFEQDDHGIVSPEWPSKPIWDRQMKPIPENIVYDETADGRIFLVWQPEFAHLDDASLADLLVWSGKARLLPLSDNYLAFIDAMLVGMEAERNTRLRRRRRVTRSTSKYPDWRDVDLLALVEARCGPGRRLGRETWFRCPFGHEDRNPSLEVNAEKRVFHCWSCGKAGGVREWHLAGGG